MGAARSRSPLLVCSRRSGRAVLALAAVLIVAAGLPVAQAQCVMCQTGLEFIAPVAALDNPG